MEESWARCRPAGVAGGSGIRAALAGDVEFAISSGVTNLVSSAAGQPLIAIANGHDRLNYVLMVNPDIAAKIGLDPNKTSQNAKAKALKGLTIASAGGAGAIPDALLQYILRSLGGLDPSARPHH